MAFEEVTLKLPTTVLQGLILIPPKAKGIVLFAHGSGSGRFSTRNQYVARVLEGAGIAVLLMDLLTPDEEQIDQLTRVIRFDIPLLSRRLSEASDWIKKEKPELQLGYFGASTGAAAALIAAAERQDVKAVVSRGGRVDLAAGFLEKVKAPTLFIVGSNDFGVIELNEEAYHLLRCEKKFEIIEGATHLFEEKGALEKVASIAKNWFTMRFHANTTSS